MEHAHLTSSQNQTSFASLPRPLLLPQHCWWQQYKTVRTLPQKKHPSPFAMPLLQPSPFLAQHIFAFLDQCESGVRCKSSDSELASALHSWGGLALQQQQRHSSSSPLPPIPFTLVKQLHFALGSGAVSGDIQHQPPCPDSPLLTGLIYLTNISE